MNKLTPDKISALLAGKMTVDEINALLMETELSHLDLDFIATGYRNLGEYQRAEEILKKAIAIDETFGDHYGNLISLYVKQEKFDDALKTFNAALEKAVSGKDLVYFHQTRAYLLQGKGELAAATCTKGINETPPYENLYLACINTYRALISEGAKNNLPKDQLQEKADQFSKILHNAGRLFPDSEEIQKIYKYYTAD